MTTTTTTTTTTATTTTTTTTTTRIVFVSKQKSFAGSQSGIFCWSLPCLSHHPKHPISKFQERKNNENSIPPTHSIHGTGIFTYIYHNKSTIHVRVNVPFVPWMIWEKIPPKKHPVWEVCLDITLARIRVKVHINLCLGLLLYLIHLRLRNHEINLKRKVGCLLRSIVFIFIGDSTNIPPKKLLLTKKTHTQLTPKRLDRVMLSMTFHLVVLFLRPLTFTEKGCLTFFYGCDLSQSSSCFLACSPNCCQVLGSVVSCDGPRGLVGCLFEKRVPKTSSSTKNKKN